MEALLDEGWRVRFVSRSRESVEAAMEELAERWGDRVAGRPTDVRRYLGWEWFLEAWLRREAETGALSPRNTEEVMGAATVRRPAPDGTRTSAAENRHTG